jgi:hypothetical protein
MVPTCVKINGNGVITAFFELSAISFSQSFTAADIKAAKDFAKQDVALGLCPKPQPPVLLKSTTNSISFGWKLPQPAGVAQKVEVQYATLSNNFNIYEVDVVGAVSTSIKAIASAKVAVTGDLQWNALVSKSWSQPDFDNYLMHNLRTGVKIVFRLKYLNFMGWSFFSDPSLPMETQPDAPCTPAPPVIGGLFPDSVQLFWFPPSLLNGRPVTEYVVRGRGVAEDVYTEVYRGPLQSYLITGLFPQQCYSFEVAAINEVGQSGFSNSVTALTLPKSKGTAAAVHAGFVNPAALANCDAWTERWDPNSNQYFYFNRITGTRQLEKPECMLSADNIRNSKTVATMTAKDQETQFRTKRFRFTLLLHKRTKQMAEASSPIRSSTQVTSSPGRVPRNTKMDAYTLELRREHLLLDAFKCFQTISTLNLQRRFKIVFIGEEGIDSGGLGKEAFLLISKQAATYASSSAKQWMKVGSNGLLFFEEVRKQAPSAPSAPPTAPGTNYANDAAKNSGTKSVGTGTGKLSSASVEALNSCIDLDARSFAMFLGRFLAKALFDRQLVDMPLSPLLLRHVVSNADDGKPGNDSKNTAKSKHNSNDNRHHRHDVDKHLHDQSAFDESKDASRADLSSGGRGTENDGISPQCMKLEPEFIELLSDLQSFDKAMHKSLSWMLHNSIEGIIYETFSVGTMDGRTVCLCANGDKKEVTDLNKIEYVKLLLRWLTHFAISDTLNPFLTSFHELVPKSLFSSDNDGDISNTIGVTELDLMLNGKTVIDVEELRPYVVYQPFKSDRKEYFKEGHPLIIWLWQMVTEFLPQQRAEFLRFFTGASFVASKFYFVGDDYCFNYCCSGCSKIPLDGFEPPLNITEGGDMVEDSLPKAHTCFNQLVIPAYSTFDKMKDKFLFAMSNAEGFELS